MATTKRHTGGLGAVLVAAVAAAGLTVGGCIVAWFAVEQHGEVVSAHRVLLEESERFIGADRDRDTALRRLVQMRDSERSAAYANATADMQRAMTTLESLANRIGARNSGPPVDELADLESTALKLAALGQPDEALEILDGASRRIARGSMIGRLSDAAGGIRQKLEHQERTSRGRASISLLTGIGSFVVSLASWVIVARGLRRRERELTEATHHARLLGMVASRTAAAVTIMDTEGRVVWVNEGWERITGIDLPTARQNHAWAMFNTAGIPGTAIDSMKSSMAAGIGCRMEVPLRSADGWLWTRLEFEAVDDPNFGRRYMTMQVDLSELKETTDKLMRAETEMRRVFSAIPGLVVSLDENQRIVHRSGDLGLAGRSRTGGSNSNVETLQELAADWDLDLIQVGLQEVRSEGRDWSCENMPARAQDGSERMLAVTASRLTSDGPGTACALLVVHDVTDRAQLTEQLERSRRLESIGQLAAGVAHEINTPAQFVSDNLRFAREAIDAIDPVLAIATRIATGGPALPDANDSSSVSDTADTADSSDSSDTSDTLDSSNTSNTSNTANTALTSITSNTAPDGSCPQASSESEGDSPTGEPTSETSERDSLRQAIDSGDLPFLREEVPAALDQALEGMERIAGIVHSMKEFSHPGERHLRSTDINRVVESSCRVCRNEWKYVADLHLQLDPETAEADCVPGELGQVILNLVVNAAHAIKARMDADTVSLSQDPGSAGSGHFDPAGSLDPSATDALDGMPAVSPDAMDGISAGGADGTQDGIQDGPQDGGSSGARRGYIGVATRSLGDEIEILVRDDGIGMDESLRLRIFDPFFTTKDVGKGTGQGLALVHAIIVDKYHGRVDVQSATGRGSIFRAVIPRVSPTRREVAA
ncbi:MAG: ATP-binding protein [Phycisphaerales bacterium]